jgi:hypothetical protein
MGASQAAERIAWTLPAALFVPGVAYLGITNGHQFIANDFKVPHRGGVHSHSDSASRWFSTPFQTMSRHSQPYTRPQLVMFMTANVPSLSVAPLSQ